MGSSVSLVMCSLTVGVYCTIQDVGTNVRCTNIHNRQDVLFLSVKSLLLSRVAYVLICGGLLATYESKYTQ